MSADQLESLAVRLLREDVDRVLDDFAQIEGADLQLQLAGLDLGEIEDVVDDVEQRAAGTGGMVAAWRRCRSSSDEQY